LRFRSSPERLADARFDAARAISRQRAAIVWAIEGPAERRAKRSSVVDSVAGPVRADERLRASCYARNSSSVRQRVQRTTTAVFFSSFFSFYENLAVISLRIPREDRIALASSRLLVSFFFHRALG